MNITTRTRFGRVSIAFIIIIFSISIIMTGCNNSIKNGNSDISGGFNMAHNVSTGKDVSGRDHRIAMIISPKGFQDVEFAVPYKYFRDNDATVDVYSTVKGIAVGSLGSVYKINETLDELNVSNYDAIVFIGGPGTPIVRSDENSERIAQQAVKERKVLGAICWSPTILAKAGVLKGKNATGWDGMDEEFSMLTSEYLEMSGAKYTGHGVTVDGNIITADGPNSAQKYAEEIWKRLESKN